MAAHAKRSYGLHRSNGRVMMGGNQPAGSPMPEEDVITEINESEGVAILKMNRPRKKNALSIALLRELRRQIAAIKENDKLRCIVLCSEGDSFSSGRDLHDMRAASSKRAIWPDEADSVIGIVRALREAPQITIAAVQGYCLGGGMV